jgi:hypothetical protein
MNANGMNWIRQEKRLAIYLRDGIACMYCGATVEDGAVMTLDHITARSAGGGHGAENLVTCCKKCNESRSDRTVEDFSAAVAIYVNHGISAEEILTSISLHIALPLRPFLAEAKTLISRRGSAAKAIAK